MKKGLQSLIITSLSIFLFGLSDLKAQELVKPVQNKAVKQAQTNNVAVESTNSNSTAVGNDNVAPFKNPDYNATGNKMGSNPGNATQDEVDYSAKKTDWIKNNPEKYKLVSGNPNLVILTEAELQNFPEDERSRILADEINYLIIK